MISTRRGFLGAFTGLASAMTFDWERLLWRPGAKHISIPSESRMLNDQEMCDLINEILCESFEFPVGDLYFRQAAFPSNEGQGITVPLAVHPDAVKFPRASQANIMLQSLAEKGDFHMDLICVNDLVRV